VYLKIKVQVLHSNPSPCSLSIAHLTHDPPLWFTRHRDIPPVVTVNVEVAIDTVTAESVTIDIAWTHMCVIGQPARVRARPCERGGRNLCVGQCASCLCLCDREPTRCSLHRGARSVLLCDCLTLCHFCRSCR